MLDNPECVYCAHTRTIKKGSGRFQCKNCGRTFRLERSKPGPTAPDDGLSNYQRWAKKHPEKIKERTKLQTKRRRAKRKST